MTIIKRTILDRRFPGKRKHADLQFGWPDAAPGPAPDVQVVGNGVVIQDGASSPGFGDHTQFVTATQSGGGTTRTFTVQNTGTSTLTTSNLSVPAGFTITEGLSASIQAGSSDTFAVRLDDATVGVKSGEITFQTNVDGKATYNFAISGSVSEPVAPGTEPTSYTVATTVRAQDGLVAGEWVTPIGVAADAGQGGIPSNKFNNIWARSQTGAWSYVQIEQARAWPDGSLKLATGHFKVPAGYVDGQKIEICVANGDGPPGLPNWATATGNYAANFEMDVSVYEPKIYLLASSGSAAIGDVIRISITDDIGTQTYQRTVRSNRNYNQVFRDLCIEMSLDPSGRYRGMKDPAAKMIPPPPDMDPNPASSDFSFVVSSSFNSNVGQVEGVNFGNGGADYNIPLILPGWPSSPTNAAYGTGRQYPAISGDPRGGYGYGFYLWPRWVSGNPKNFTVNVEVVRQPGSTLAFRTNLLGTSTTDNGEPIVMQTPINRANYTLAWSAATETPRSPYFTGRNIRQNERKIGLPGTTVDFRMSVSWDATGSVVDCYVQAENSRMHSGAADAYYDVTAIRLNGVNQLSTPELLEDHRDLHHYVFKKWRWHKPKKLAMCDPSSYMRTGLHGAFETFPTDDNVDTLQIFSRGAPPCAQGSNFNGGDLYKINPVQLAARGGFQNPRPNKPLWSGPVAFDGAGGARPGIALYDLLGTIFLTSNVFTHWEDFLACADNVFSNFPWYVRDERAANAGPVNNVNTVDADQSDYAPNPYKAFSNSLGFDHTPDPAWPRAKPMLLGVAKQSTTQTWGVGRQFTPNYKVFSLYHGYQGGSYGWLDAPTPSHHPPHAAKVAYMVRPEACFLDSLEQYAWGAYTVYAGAPPKTGGAILDADHRAGWAIVNGNRGFSWPWRDVCHAGSMIWDAHPRRSMWTRWASDGGDYFRRNVTNTWGGVFHGQAAANSNNWTTAHVAQKAGNVDRTWNSSTKKVLSMDLFKSAYVTQVATLCHSAGLADLSDALSVNMLWHRHLDDAAPAGREWWRLWGLWNNLLVAPNSVMVSLSVASSAGFSAGDLVSVTTSGFAGTVESASGNTVVVRSITNYGEPLAGQTLSNGTASTTLNNAGSGKGYVSAFPTAASSRDGVLPSESVVDFFNQTEQSLWLFSNNYRRNSEPTGNSPFGFGASSGYYNEAFHWKALYGQALFGTNATEKAKAQTWINFFNARFDPGALQTIGQLSQSYPYSHPDYRLRLAIGAQHCWVAPSEIVGQAW